jgi:hypothetical protein
MHPSIIGLLDSFSYVHLPEGKIRDTSKEFHDLAHRLAYGLPSSADVTYGLRTLWEAKNVFVYAAAAEEKAKASEPSNTGEEDKR